MLSSGIIGGAAIGELELEAQASRHATRQCELRSVRVRSASQLLMMAGYVYVYVLTGSSWILDSWFNSTAQHFAGSTCECDLRASE